MQMARLAEAHRAAQPRRAAELKLARLQHDRLVQRMMIRALALADINSQQHRFAWDSHCYTPRLSAAAATYPIDTDRMHRITEPAAFSTAGIHSPACIRSSVSSEKLENV